MTILQNELLLAYLRRFTLAKASFRKIVKAWFPYDRPDLASGQFHIMFRGDRDDYMETLLRRSQTTLATETDSTRSSAIVSVNQVSSSIEGFHRDHGK